VWQLGPTPAAGFVTAPISFPIPLETAFIGSGEDNQFHILEAGEGETEDCPGTLEDPQAEPGQACIYTSGATNATPTGTAGPFVSGALLFFIASEAGATAVGTWAVTAP